MIVVAIIGILAGGLISLMDPAGQLRNSRDSKRKSDLKQIQAALELYRADLGAYPSSADSAFGNDVANLNESSLVDNPAEVQVTYLPTVPKDPSTNTHYYYCTSSLSPCSAASGYRIYACLERSSDPDKKTGSAPITCATGFTYVTNP